MDLTNDTSLPTMASAKSKRRASHAVPTDNVSLLGESSSKRRKTKTGSIEGGGLKNEVNDQVEGYDLTSIDDDTGLAKALQNQQEAAIKAQREGSGDKPTKLSNLQCIICLETTKNLTATHCGELYDEVLSTLIVNL